MIKSFKYNNSGFSLLESLVSMSIAVMVIGALFDQYTSSAIYLTDLRKMTAADTTVRSVLTMLAGELKLIGNGVPFDQLNFQMDDDLQDQAGTLTSGLSIAYPIDLASTATSITYKVNELGNTYVLAQNYTPVASGTIFLDSVSGLSVGNPIYVSNASIGGADGFYSTIASINTGANSITTAATYYRSPSATFNLGSTFEPVTTVTLSQSGTNVVRNSGTGNVTFAENATISISYLNKAGTAITLPMTMENLKGDIGSLQVTLTVTTTENTRFLSGPGTTYSSSLTQIIGLRSFNF